MNENNETQSVEVEETAIVELDLTFKPEIFDPNKEQLRAIAAEVAKIEADPAKMDKDTLELINTTKNKLVKARTRIQKIGKAQREPANAYAKEVKAYEDELLAILAPEEARMKDLEKAAKEKALQDERRKTLPEFIEKLNTIGDGIEAEESFLLSLDPNQRDAYYNERLSAKLNADKAAADAKAAEEQAAKEKALLDLINARTQIMLEIGFKRSGDNLVLAGYTPETTFTISTEAIETATEAEFAEGTAKWRATAEETKKEEIKRVEEEAKAKAEEEARQKAAAEEAERQAAEEAAKKEAEEKAAKEAQEKQEREKAEAFQKWKVDHSYNPETDTLIEDEDQNGRVTILYREVSRYTHQNTV